MWVDAFSRWVEALPCRAEWTKEVVKALAQEIIACFGFSRGIQRDNVPAFTAAVTQGISRALQIEYRLHCAWRPQMSGKVEKTNETLKKQLCKVLQETHGPLTTLLLLALLRLRNTPKTLGVSPFEMLYGLSFSKKAGGPSTSLFL